MAMLRGRASCSWADALLAVAGTILFGTVPTQAETARPPLQWAPPKSFDAEKPGLGLPVHRGLQNRIIFRPKPSKACVDEGGDGKYESVSHGTYNHQQEFVLYKDKIIVYWFNHAKDEDAPGQRLLAKVGTFNKDLSDIDWGGDETLVELAGPPAPVRRRCRTFDPNLIAEAGIQAWPRVINGRLYVTGFLDVCHGWTNDIQYHKRVYAPIPAENWSDVEDPDHGFRWDMWCDAGLRFAQQWEVEGNTLQPVSALYKTQDLKAQVEVTPGRFKKVLKPLGLYADASPFSEAPMTMRDDILNGTPENFVRVPKYAPGTEKLAVDGKHGLTHYTEFKRPDGTWVAVRDNLLNPTNYYAAAKVKHDDVYPPGVQTNLFGCAMPTAGELPDGRPWIVCNDESRHNMYLTLSEDGYLFDRTWLLLHLVRDKSDDGYGKAGGPQYFQSVMVGGNIWVVYSVTKEWIGVMKVPIRSLHRSGRNPN